MPAMSYVIIAVAARSLGLACSANFPGGEAIPHPIVITVPNPKHNAYPETPTKTITGIVCNL